jgi:hypothetical protein
MSEMRPPANLLIISQVIYEYGEPWWNDTDRRIQKYSEKTTVPMHILSTTNPTLSDHGLRGERSATGHCSSAKRVFIPSLTFLTLSKLVYTLGASLMMYVLSLKSRSRVSSGSIVSDYGLDDRAIGVLFPAGAKDFSCSLCVQTGSGPHSDSCPMGTGGPFPGGKSAARA